MTDTSAQALDGFPCIIELPVQWGEMDAMGHVNNAVYFRYFESARIAYFDASGFFAQLKDAGLGPILAHTDCRFRLPLTSPDTVAVGARVVALGDDRLQMSYRAVSRQHGKVAAEGGGRVVCFDYRAGEKAAFPDAVREALTKFEGGALAPLERSPR